MLETAAGELRNISDRFAGRAPTSNDTSLWSLRILQIDQILFIILFQNQTKTKKLNLVQNILF